MPNFAKSETGHSSPAIVENGIYYFTVIEEWNDGAVSITPGYHLYPQFSCVRYQGAVGRKIGLTYNTIVYNGTA